jgi:hypothetical protein
MSTQIHQRFKHYFDTPSQSNKSGKISSSEDIHNSSNGESSSSNSNKTPKRLKHSSSYWRSHRRLKHPINFISMYSNDEHKTKCRIIAFDNNTKRITPMNLHDFKNTDYFRVNTDTNLMNDDNLQPKLPTITHQIQMFDSSKIKHFSDGPEYRQFPDFCYESPQHDPDELLNEYKFTTPVKSSSKHYLEKKSLRSFTSK